MARPLRIEFAGGLYHVMSRGNDRRAIVRDDADRQRRLDWLERTVETYGWRLHAFVLMTNHEHLFVETPEANLSAGMHLLNGSYTGYFNLRHRRVGHLFQGRFKAHLVEEEGYFTEISRYIHLNPLRAKLVAKPEQWKWSSYGGYRSSKGALGWVTYDRVLGEFGGLGAEARRSYCRFVQAGVKDPPPSPWKDAVGGFLVGSESFAMRVRRLLDGRTADPEVPQVEALRARPALDQIVAVVADHFRCAPDEWSSGRRSDALGRATAAYLARCRFGYSMVAIAKALGYRGHSGVATAVARVEAAGSGISESLAVLEKRLANV
jgi:REP-associated tyrosine transposase